MVVTVREILEENEFKWGRDAAPERQKSKGFMHVDGRGKFHCHKCDNRWSSQEASLLVNLLRPRVMKVYRQSCHCGNEECKPHFSPADFWDMIENCIDRAKNQPSKSNAFRKVNGQHRTRDCERCKYGDEHLH